MSNQVKEIFDSYPDQIRNRLLAIRECIFERAASLQAVGELEETLKWSEPAYLTAETGAGTTIRLNWKPATPDLFRILVHCQTTVIDTCRGLYPELTFDGNRAIVLTVKDELPVRALSHCIDIALTYHSAKR